MSEVPPAHRRTAPQDSTDLCPVFGLYTGRKPSRPRLATPLNQLYSNT